VTFFGMALLTTAGTIVLAVFAIVTAWYARKAFLKQSKEVGDQAEMLDLQRTQLAEQEKTSAKQTVVLELQAADLRKSLEEREREAAARQRVQAEGVTVWLTTDRHPVGGTPLQAAVLSNQSIQPIYDVQAYLHYMEEGRLGTEWTPAMGGASQIFKIVTPHSDLHVILPQDASPRPEEDEYDGNAYAASIIFTDAAGNRWERDPRRVLNPAPPDAAYKVTRA
jgi:hypothetical protein